ncbi:interleukin-12 receptor subunit beta-2 isoform X2 [Sceloporus undulatus]|uniref:interleukin-12 receptor subunit beta-2 isoform X2 n=1 Tax=Sceloporus undulatus TaxID=8520 RepID=UPI001C4DAFE8|nr:interleukin-12 receptor subunit beta-2 isoform X2 [Sceloporus undulatus]
MNQKRNQRNNAHKRAKHFKFRQDALQREYALNTLAFSTHGIWGYMNASSAGTYLSHGSTITLSCWPNRSGVCILNGFYKISILQNNREVNHSNGGHPVSTLILLDTLGKHTFKCECGKSQSTPMLICGINIYVGIPPDQPKNILCHQYGKNGSATCSWDKGRSTHLVTTYTIQLTYKNGTFLKVIDSKDNKVDLKVNLDFKSIYTVVVTATNNLGNVSAQPIQFASLDIVQPYSPVNLSVKFDDSAATNCTILWQNNEDPQHFRLRYQPVHSSSWTMCENIQTRRYELHGLKPDTEYKFQISSRFLPNKGLWSDWSIPFQTEADSLFYQYTCYIIELFCFYPVPFEPIDVWYLQKDVSSQTQNITLFWKAMETSERRSKNHGYRVTFQTISQKPYSASTVHTVFSQLIPKTGYNITVCSYNLRGISPPVHITTKLGITDLPPPRDLSAVSEENESIVVTWKAPLTPSLFINGYIVDWTEFHQDEPLKSHPTWIKVPASNFTIKIENLKPNVCYQINVFALYQSRAGKAASTTENVSAKAPLTGLHINTTIDGGRILVSWEDLPFNQQMGCIINYRIYVQKQSLNVPFEFYDISKSTLQPYSINNVSAGAVYAVWMTASTKAGESPKGNEEIIYIKNSISHKDAPEGILVIVLCAVGLLACTCCVPPARQKFFSFLSVLSGCYGKAVPDPANSSCAKKFIFIQDDSSLHFTQFLNKPSSFEEPESLTVEEAFMKRQYPTFEDRAYIKNCEKEESQNCPMTGTLLEDDPIEKNLNYDPLIPSISGDTNKHQLLPLYRKVAPKDPNQGQVFSDYLANPLEDTTVDYLPTITATVMNNDEDSSDSELNSLSVFPRTFLSQPFSLGGKLTLDAIRMDFNS